MSPTLYEELELKPDCSSKDIKGAFIKLSKLHHPDINGSTDTSHKTHTKFVKINEAYSILSKPDKRQEYDFSLKVIEVPYYSPSPGQDGHHVWRDETIFRPGSNDFRRAKNKPYYGIKGLKKISNSWIVVACAIFTGLGVGLQFVAISKSFNYAKDIRDQKSVASYNTYREIRERASATNRSQQLDRLKTPEANVTDV